MPCAMAMGQAAGTAASIAIDNDSLPENVDIAVLQTLLKENGAILD